MCLCALHTVIPFGFTAYEGGSREKKQMAVAEVLEVLCTLVCGAESLF